MKGDYPEAQTSKVNGTQQSQPEQNQQPQQSRFGFGKVKSGGEQLEQLMRDFDLQCPEKPTLTSLPGAVPLDDNPVSNTNLWGPSEFNAPHNPFTSSSQLPMYRDSYIRKTQSHTQHAKQDMPAILPIGTEVKLGLIPKTHHTSRSHSSSFAPDILGPDFDAWYRTTGHAASIRPPTHAQALALSSVMSTLIDSDHQQSNRSALPATSTSAYLSALQQRHAMLNTNDRTVAAVGQERTQVGPRRSSLSNASEAASSAVSLHAEEYEFADSIDTPAYGTIFGPYNRTRSTSTDSPHLDHISHNGSSHYPPTRAAQQIRENNLVSESRRRWSGPLWSEKPADPEAPAHTFSRLFTYRHTSVNPTMLSANVNPSQSNPHANHGVNANDRLIAPSRNQLVRSNSPTHRFSVPDPHKAHEWSSMSHSETRQLRSVGYNNNGMLPAAWPDSTGAPSYSGDWTCQQIFCKYENFQRNADCRKCGHPRTPAFASSSAYSNHQANRQPPPPPAHRIDANHHPPLGSFGDWKCECGYTNWRRRIICNGCYPDHPSNQDRRPMHTPSNTTGVNASASNGLHLVSAPTSHNGANGLSHNRAIGHSRALNSSAVRFTPPTSTLHGYEHGPTHASAMNGTHAESSRQAQDRYHSARSVSEWSERDWSYRGNGHAADRHA
ncbi:hypothetical protein IAU59_000808 [Kwoniella sp. CBS 9459]